MTEGDRVPNFTERVSSISAKSCSAVLGPLIDLPDVLNVGLRHYLFLVTNDMLPRRYDGGMVISTAMIATLHRAVELRPILSKLSKSKRLRV